MKNEMMETNQTGFLALQDFDLADVMCAEMDGLSAAFERVKIPSGGGVMFEIPGENPEEPDTVKTFSAVILYQHSLNAYYQSEYQGGSNPPDCGSFDGHHGEGNPGGSCDSCPLNQYGSGSIAIVRFTLKKRCSTQTSALQNKRRNRSKIYHFGQNWGIFTGIVSSFPVQWRVIKKSGNCFKCKCRKSLWRQVPNWYSFKPMWQSAI